MILGGLSAALGLLCCGSLWFWVREKAQSNQLRSLLASSEGASCLFVKNRCIMCSPQIGQFLGEDHLPLSNTNQLSILLSPQDHYSLAQSIDSLIQTEAPFTLNFQLQDNSRWIKLEGRSLDEKNLWGLWISDTTSQNAQSQAKDMERHKNEIMMTTLKGLLDTLPFLVWHRDEQQKINYCNKYYSQAVHVSQPDVAKDSVELIDSAKARSLARKALNVSQPQSLSSFAIVFGERKKLEIYEQPNPMGDGTIGYAIDQTEIEDTKSTLGKIIDSFSDILDHQSTAIAIYGTDGKLNYFNKAYQALNEFDETWLSSEPRLDEVLEELRQKRLIPEYADFPAYKKRSVEALTKQMGPQEELVHLPNGRTLRMISTPHPTGGLLFMIEDVTDHLTLERRNKALLEVQKTTLENLYEGIVVFGSDNRIKLSNPSFRNLWGLEEKDVQANQHLSHVIDKIEPYFEYEGEWKNLKGRIVENTTDRIPKSGQIHRNDGTVLRYLYVPLPNGDNLLCYIDITDNSRVEDALRERTEALEAADHLKTEFIANVSYEFRAPLNTITGFSEILSQEYYGELNEKQLDYIHGILNSSDKLLHLVNNILDLGSIEAGQLNLQPHPQSVKAILDDVVQLMSSRASEKKVEIEVKCPRTVTTWMLDGKRIKQALFNLLNNSLKYTPKGGKVTLSAAHREGDLHLSVSDTGSGIAKADQERVFEKFERGSNEEEGAGLGLALVKSLIELHGGKVSLSSRASKGTKVTCCLPDRIPANQDEEAGTPLVVEYSK